MPGAFFAEVLQMRPIRVLHLVNVLDVGGMEAGVVKLVNGSDSSRVQAGICSFSPAEAFKRRLVAGVPLFEFARRNGNDPGLVLQLIRLFRRERPDIVHTHGWGTLCEGSIAARVARVAKVVHGEHGTLETRFRNIAVQRFVWRRVNRVLSVSERLAERMARVVNFPKERIQTIRNGVDLDRFLSGNRSATRALLNVQDDELLVLAIGRLVGVKNHRMLIDSIPRLRALGVRGRLIIAGDGPLRADLERQARALGIASSVQLLGTRDDLPDLLAACDIFVLSSLSEGMSNTVLEAMSAGRPVVATDVGGNAELVVDQETGVLVRTDDPELMTLAMFQLARDRGRREQMGAAGRRRAEREFSLSQMLRNYEAMYLDVAAGRPLTAASARLTAVAMSHGGHRER
jgi:sugar transferase (PEP-CTERM/EpsH1 system associated)